MMEDTSFIHRDPEPGAPCRAYSCPVELRDKALRELKETPELQRECVTELRRALTTECSSLREEARMDDPFLIRFLRPKKYVVAKALNLYKNYYKLRESRADVFEDLHPGSVRHVWESGFMGCLSDRDREGRNVLLAFSQHWNPQEVSLRDALRSFILQLEFLIESEETQINGVSLIVDFSKFTFEQIRSLHPSYVQLLVNLVQVSTCVFMFMWCVCIRRRQHLYVTINSPNLQLFVASCTISLPPIMVYIFCVSTMLL